MKIRAALVSSVLLTATASSVFAADHSSWGYAGQDGPEHWASLDAAYSLCGNGKNQSPIDLVGEVKADLPSIKFNYQASAKDIVNNGHAVQVNYAAGSGIDIDGDHFELKQFHFHSPSENQIDGKSFPMEGHLVHADKDGNLAVVAVMFEEGADNATLAYLWKHMPKNKGDDNALNKAITVSGILPKNKDYYRFNGSLTTPPCTEGVRWFVMKQPVTLSHEQVEQFAHVMHHDNNRPVQRLNARAVLK